MIYGVKKEKSLLRAECLQKRRQIPEDLRAELQRKICESILNSVSYKYYDTLLLYSAVNGEPDLSYLAVRALRDGKRVAYPRCIKDSRLMTFHFIEDPSQLVPGAYGISEPTGDLPAFDPEQPSCSVCFIPAIAADKSGYRVGYGGGYYDRFLSAYHGTAAAVTYACFLFDKVPRGQYDIQTDFTVTEGGILTVVKN